MEWRGGFSSQKGGKKGGLEGGNTQGRWAQKKNVGQKTHVSWVSMEWTAVLLLLDKNLLIAQRGRREYIEKGKLRPRKGKKGKGLPSDRDEKKKEYPHFSLGVIKWGRGPSGRKRLKSEKKERDIWCVRDVRRSNFH